MSAEETLTDRPGPVCVRDGIADHHKLAAFLYLHGFVISVVEFMAKQSRLRMRTRLYGF
jgi:hypothetical protein